MKKGQKIAEMGSTDADRVKLHFEVRRQGKPGRSFVLSAFALSMVTQRKQAAQAPRPAGACAF